MNNRIFNRFIYPSTRSFYHESRKIEKLSFFTWLHGYVYGRWPYLYIGVGVGEHWLANLLAPVGEFLLKLLPGHPGENDVDPRQAFADSYHGKVIPLEEASRLVMVEKEIDLGDLEQIIPYNQARDIVLKHPDHIVALDCPCRVARENPCLPLDVCLIIGEPFAGFITEHQPQRTRWISRAEALQILQEEHERGHVHHAFFKDAMLGRFYAICNCCSCCCGAMQAFRNGTPMLASSGYVSQIETNNCILCEECVEHCQFGALRIVNDTIKVDEKKCMGCGVCIDQCSQSVFQLVRAPEKGEPLEILSLMEAAEQKSQVNELAERD